MRAPSAHRHSVVSGAALRPAVAAEVDRYRTLGAPRQRSEQGGAPPTSLGPSVESAAPVGSASPLGDRGRPPGERVRGRVGRAFGCAGAEQFGPAAVTAWCGAARAGRDPSALAAQVAVDSGGNGQRRASRGGGVGRARRVSDNKGSVNFACRSSYEAAPGCQRELFSRNKLIACRGLLTGWV